MSWSSVDCGCNSSSFLGRGTSPKTRSMTSRSCALFGDDVDTVRPERERYGAIERGAAAGVRLVDDPLAIVDFDPVPHRVAEERAAGDRPRERDPARGAT